VADIERGWIHTSAHTKQQLALMQVLTGFLVKYQSVLGCSKAGPSR
jgi:hypothetical protein